MCTEFSSSEAAGYKYFILSRIIFFQNIKNSCQHLIMGYLKDVSLSATFFLVKDRKKELE